MTRCDSSGPWYRSLNSLSPAPLPRSTYAVTLDPLALLGVHRTCMHVAIDTTTTGGSGCDGGPANVLMALEGSDHCV
jgi:hypothetical protein